MKMQAAITTRTDEATALAWLLASEPALAGRTVTRTTREDLGNYAGGGFSLWTFHFASPYPVGEDPRR